MLFCEKQGDWLIGASLSLDAPWGNGKGDVLRQQRQGFLKASASSVTAMA
jgi:hypothetical protein